MIHGDYPLSHIGADFSIRRNAFHARGFLLFGGALDDTRDALWIIRAENVEEIRSRLPAYCRSRSSLLHIAQFALWILRPGKLES